MKQTKAEVLAKKTATIERVVTQMYQEMMNLKDLSIGTHELVKKIPGYNEALEALMKEQEEKNNEKKLDLPNE